MAGSPDALFAVDVADWYSEKDDTGFSPRHYMSILAPVKLTVRLT